MSGVCGGKKNKRRAKGEGRKTLRTVRGVLRCGADEGCVRLFQPSADGVFPGARWPVCSCGKPPAFLRKDRSGLAQENAAPAAFI